MSNDLAGAADAGAGSGSTTQALAGWLEGEAVRLVEWARRSRLPLGFGYLDAEGAVDEEAELSLLISARMSYVFALAALRGDADARDDAAHGMAALAPGAAPGEVGDGERLGGIFWDAANGGWNSLALAGGAPTRKAAYDHAFVLLAASTAHLAGVPGSVAVVEAASAVLLERFWRESEGALADSFSADWSLAENYRGANANMHLVEACLATAEATGDAAWLDRALRIADRLINVNARGNSWRILEHFDEVWDALPEYNSDNPADQFRPYGYLVGHSFEWARLLLHLAAALRARGRSERWLAEAAAELWSAAIRAAWEVDGQPGLLYSLGWDDKPVISLRLHWVISEAIAAAWALHATTGDEAYLDWHDRLWALVRERFVDVEHGSWHHELTPSGQPSAVVWPGKPDVYHALNAVLLSLGTFDSMPATGIRGST